MFPAYTPACNGKGGARGTPNRKGRFLGLVTGSRAVLAKLRGGDIQPCNQKCILVKESMILVDIASGA